MVLSSSAEYLSRACETLGESVDVDVDVVDEMTLRHCTW
jgi:hypothetical protein